MVVANEGLFVEAWSEIEGAIGTMARKDNLPGMTLDDWMQEYKVEAWKAWEWHNPKRSKLSSFMWQLIKKRRADIFRDLQTQGRDITRERYFYSVEGTEVSANEQAIEGNRMSVGSSGHVDHPCVPQELGNAHRVGNASRYFDLMMLNIEHNDKCVLLLLSAGFGVNETVDKMIEDVDPEFNHNRFYKVMRKLYKNPNLAVYLSEIPA